MPTLWAGPLLLHGLPSHLSRMPSLAKNDGTLTEADLLAMKHEIYVAVHTQIRTVTMASIMQFL